MLGKFPVWHSRKAADTEKRWSDKGRQAGGRQVATRQGGVFICCHREKSSMQKEQAAYCKLMINKDYTAIPVWNDPWSLFWYELDWSRWSDMNKKHRLCMSVVCSCPPLAASHHHCEAHINTIQRYETLTEAFPIDATFISPFLTSMGHFYFSLVLCR